MEGGHNSFLKEPYCYLVECAFAVAPNAFLFYSDGGDCGVLFGKMPG